MANFLSFTGVIAMIDDFWTGSGAEAGCTKLITVENTGENIVNFVVTPATYFIDHVMVAPGDVITGFYDANAPAPAIYPPQLQAIVMTRVSYYQHVKVDFFNRQLVSSDGALKLNIAPTTQVILENDQRFSGVPANRDLIVVYGATTRSIPAQTTPDKIIVMC